MPDGLRRQPTTLELASRCDFVAMAADWDTTIAGLLAKFHQVRADQIDQLADLIRQAVDDGDLEALADLTVTTGAGADILAPVLADLAQRAADRAVSEAAGQGVRLPPPDLSVVLAHLDARAEVTDRYLAGQLSQTATQAALPRFGVSTTGTDVAKAVQGVLDGLSDRQWLDQLNGAVVAAEAGGRSTVYEQADADPTVSTTYLASELLDGNTCDACADIDGTEWDNLEDAEAAYPDGGFADCYGGERCRGTLVAILEEAAPTLQQPAAANEAA